jgi:6-phosphogluconolactonase
MVYSINKETGELTFVQRQLTYGKNPRDFAIDPTGKYLLVANQDSDSIMVFRIDQANGVLSLTRNRLEVGNPVCLKFTPAE